jgi:hypothetical protein
MDGWVVLLFGLAVEVVCAIYARRIARRKGHDGAMWFWIGFMLGPFGVTFALNLRPTAEIRFARPRRGRPARARSRAQRFAKPIEAEPRDDLRPRMAAGKRSAAGRSASAPAAHSQTDARFDVESLTVTADPASEHGDGFVVTVRITGREPVELAGAPWYPPRVGLRAESGRRIVVWSHSRLLIATPTSTGVVELAPISDVFLRPGTGLLVVCECEIALVNDQAEVLDAVTLGNAVADATWHDDALHLNGLNGPQGLIRVANGRLQTDQPAPIHAEPLPPGQQ